MLPLIAGMVGRAALSVGTRAAAGTATRAAVTSAARSGTISAGAGSAAASSSRVLSTMQFGASAARALHTGGNAAPAPAPAPADDLGWARS
ncbi:hypothetical protein [Streptomyces sp. NPDC088775]|uniref:hypothetical protein n=1 Tax=Streptomyces sp. NPDC088775 TaxID=3365896 RepID=UPI0037FFFD0A